MKNTYNRYSITLILCFSLLLISSIKLKAQFSGKVAYIATATAIGADADKPFIDKLKSWGFTVEMIDVAAFKSTSAPTPTVADLKNYKLMYVSESISSGDLARLRGATGTTWATGWLPIPCVNSDNWASRVSALGFVPASAGYGSIDGKVIVVDQSSHPMSAGFSSSNEVSLTTGTTSSTATDQYTYVTPDAKVNVIPIGASSQDQTKLIVFGVEKGTEVYNSAGVFGGTTKTIARYASVGIHALAYSMITDDGWKFVKAAITWVLASGTDVENTQSVPTEYSLNQNFPNPFNPTTKISFSLPKEDMTKLEVYNVLGEQVATLVNQNLSVGTHHFTFDASQYSSGIYFYKLVSGNFSSVKKMLLIK